MGDQRVIRNTAETKIQLERMIDLYGIADLLGFIMEICADKAAHVSENWQDQPLAKRWERTSDDLDKLINKILPRFT